MPHAAAERVCPNTGLRLVNEARPATREGRSAEANLSRMSELPPPSCWPEPLAFDPQRDRVGERKPNASSGEVQGTMPPTRDLNRELLGQTVGGRYKTTEVYLRADVGEKLAVARAIIPPSLRRGRFPVPDTLLASLMKP